MTRLQAITQAGQLLGDTSTAFLAILENLYDQVLSELAAYDAIRSLWADATFTFTANVSNYNTRTITGMAAPNYPLAIRSLVVPAWGPSSGILERREREDFMRLRLLNVDSNGNPVVGRPKYWQVYPTEAQLQVTPTPSADFIISNGVEINYLNPPTVIADGTDITEIRSEHIPAIIRGMVKFGLVFQDETIIDKATAGADYELFKRAMKRQNRWEAGRAVRIKYIDF